MHTQGHHVHHLDKWLCDHMLGHRVLFTTESQVPSVRSLHQVGSGHGMIACVQGQLCCPCLGNCVVMVRHGHISVWCVELRFTELTPCNLLVDCISYRYDGNGVHEEMGFCGVDSLLELCASCNDDYTTVGVNSMVMLLDC